MEKNLMIKILLGMYHIMICKNEEDAEEIFRIVRKKLIDEFSGRVSVRSMDKIKALLTMTLSIMRTIFRDSKKRGV